MSFAFNDLIRFKNFFHVFVPFEHLQTILNVTEKFNIPWIVCAYLSY